MRADWPLVVDAHCHLGAFRNFHIPDNDIDGMVHVMDLLGIDVAVVAAHAGIYADYRFGNDQVMAAAARHPGRVLGYCCINPNYSSEVAGELERCFADPAFRGIKLHPELHGDYPLDGPAYRPVWEYAAEHRVPVLSHSYFAGDPLGVFAALADEYPTVPLLLGHAGLDYGLDRVVGVVAERRNIHLDLTGPLSWDGVVEYLVGELGPDRLIFGSDMPFMNAPLQLGGCVYARVDHAAKERILGANAAALFGIEPGDRRDAALAEVGESGAPA
ncbi:amidohydrolase family protein [Sphaerimonospora mesophila]|uniref:amidohydrolase family protein n=1 Tax=Sphaerimonospora mesophila TaxID=37483 RepID=UPI0006E2749E